MADKHIEATTCPEAKENLFQLYGPIHKTAWGCFYSESEKGWFRPECEVTPPTAFVAAKEMAKNFWATAGGVFLILFIILISFFMLWWVSGCVRLRKPMWFWKIRKELDYERVTYRRQKNNKNVNGQYGVDSDEDGDDLNDVYLGNGTN